MNRLPLPQHLTHKVCRTQALIMDYGNIRREKDVLRCDVGYDIPRAHWSVATTRKMPGTVPVILGFEVIRQAGIAASHLLAAASSDTAFVLSNIDFAWEHPISFEGAMPVRGTVHVELHDVTDRGCRYVFALRDDEEQVIGRGSIEAFWATPKAYAHIRRHAPEPVERHDGSYLLNVGADTKAGSLVAQLGWDTHDPFMFDHAVDHLPGMLFIAACNSIYPRMSGGAFTFVKYGELNADVDITADAEGQVSFVQSGAELASAVVRFREHLRA